MEKRSAKYKNIKGKRIRTAPEITKGVNAIFVGVFFLTPIVMMFFMEDKTYPVAILCGVMFAFFRLFIPGPVLCVLADDRIYYFADKFRVDVAEYDGVRRRVFSADGWISYRAIERYDFKPAGRFLPSMLTVFGDGFELRLRCVNESLIAKIDKMRENAVTSPAAPRSESPEIIVEREGVWKSVWERFSTCNIFDELDCHGAEVQFEMYENTEMDMIDLIVTDGEASHYITLQADGVTLSDFEGDCESTFGYEKVSGSDDVMKLIREYIEEKKKTK